ncbi:MAG: hypothetical protein M0Z27_10650, partial [Thermaerobacter sp.]|nr:hypothetical protein [Thermaerobacter sp.]
MNRELRRVVAAVVLGAILGATGTFAAAGRQLHGQRLANVALQAQLDRLRSEHADLRARLEQLSRRRGAARLVQEVTVSVRYPDPVYRLEIERQAHALLAKLPGTVPETMAIYTTQAGRTVFPTVCAGELRPGAA